MKLLILVLTLFFITPVFAQDDYEITLAPDQETPANEYKTYLITHYYTVKDRYNKNVQIPDPNNTLKQASMVELQQQILILQKQKLDTMANIDAQIQQLEKIKNKILAIQ